MRQMRDLYFVEDGKPSSDKSAVLQERNLDDVDFVKHFDQIVPHLIAMKNKEPGEVVASRRMASSTSGSDSMSMDQLKMMVMTVVQSDPTWNMFDDDDVTLG